MATNSTTVSTSLDRTFVLPISYAGLSFIDNVSVSDQLSVFRKEIADHLSSYALTTTDYRRVGRIPSSWLTVNVNTNTITAITIPTGATATLENGTTVSIPAMVSGEELLVERKQVYSEALVEWITGTRITADQLNLNTAQLLGAIQEIYDSLDLYIRRDDQDVVVNPLTSNLNANQKKITNLAEPTTDHDAATKSYVDEEITENVTDQLGVANGIATLGPDGKLAASQLDFSSGSLPGSFLSGPTGPVWNVSTNNFDFGSLWYSTTNGRIYVFVPKTPSSATGDGFWVDVSAPVGIGA